jgi:hypothetical protein
MPIAGARACDGSHWSQSSQRSSFGSRARIRSRSRRSQDPAVGVAFYWVAPTMAAHVPRNEPSFVDISAVTITP